jgi:hypothetical protein
MPAPLSEDLTSLRNWARKNVRRAEEEGYCTQPLHQRILKAWRMYHPEMVARLQRASCLEDMALACQYQMWKAVNRYEEAGLPPTDAREQAEREWLMLAPDEREEPEEENPEEPIALF